MTEIFPKDVVAYSHDEAVSQPEHTSPFQGSGVTVQSLQTAAPPTKKKTLAPTDQAVHYCRRKLRWRCTYRPTLKWV